MDAVKILCNKPMLKKTATVKPNPKNPNEHSDDQVARLAKLITAHGWRVPITVSERSGLVVRGHGRLAAAKLLEMDKVPVDVQPYRNAKEEYADLIADNIVADLAEMDRVMLKDGLEWLDDGAFDMDLTGYDEGDLEDIMTAAPPDGEGGQGQEKPAQCPKCGHEFTA